MKVTLIQSTPITACIEAAGVCQEAEYPDRALKNALAMGHVNLLEHWNASFKIESISRACSHQLVRQRIGFSPTQKSQRHTSAVGGFVLPDLPYMEIESNLEAMDIFLRQWVSQEKDYIKLLELGVAKEDARYILGQGFTTDLVLTINGTALTHFFNQRMCSRAQWEIRSLANRIFDICYRIAPDLFRGPFPNCKKCDNPCGDNNAK